MQHRYCLSRHACTFPGCRHYQLQRDCCSSQHQASNSQGGWQRHSDGWRRGEQVLLRQSMLLLSWRGDLPGGCA